MGSYENCTKKSRYSSHFILSVLFDLTSKKLFYRSLAIPGKNPDLTLS